MQVLMDPKIVFHLQTVAQYVHQENIVLFQGHLYPTVVVFQDSSVQIDPRKLIQWARFVKNISIEIIIVIKMYLLLLIIYSLMIST